MPEIGTSIAVASVIVGLLTIPAASKSLNSAAPVKASLPNISSDKVPKEVETSVSDDSFSREIDTAFRKFSTEINSGKAESSIETSASRLTVSRTPGRTKSVLKSPKGELTVVESADSVRRTVETPFGTLEISKEQGEVKKSFEGSERERVEKIESELMAAMKEKRQQIEERNAESRAQRLASSLELEVNPDSPEHVVLNNTGSRAVNLDGWKLFNNNPDSYSFSEVVLGAGEVLRAYSEERKDLNLTEGESSYVYGTGLTWENSGDKATLKLSSGHEVLEESY